MNILFVTHYSDFYGANKSLLALTVLLRKKHGIKPLVLLPNEGPMCQKLEEQGIEYLVSPFYWWVNYNHGLLQWALNKRKQWINWRRAKKICSQIKGYSVDLVYSNSVCINFGFLIAQRMGLPHIWQFRESLTSFSFSFSLSLPSTRRIFASKVNKRYVLVSDYMMSFYETYLPHERMVCVYNGVDLPVGTARLEENKIHDRLQVACVGLISDQKNQMELLRAQSILHKRGVDIETWFAGYNDGSDYRASLEEYSKANDLEGLTHYVGHSDQVYDGLRKMNLGVVTARDEAFGRVTIEYMLMKLPVVGSRSGATPELVRQGVTGELYELGDVTALADLIEGFVKQPELLVSQGEAAFLDATERFSAERNADRIYEQIVDVLSSK